MVKPITTKRELQYFEQYLQSIKDCNCRNVDRCYRRPSDTKRRIYLSITKECASNHGSHLTVVSASPYRFTTSYIIDAGNGEVYFVRHSKSSRVEYKLNKEQQEMIPWLEK